MKSLTRLALCLGTFALYMVTASSPAGAACIVGGSVSDVNDCIPSGGSPADCLLEWSVSPVPPLDPRSGAPTKKIECLDNDPSCDSDITPGQCTFMVGACVNVTDPRLPKCTPSDAASYVLKKPSEKDTLKPHKNRFTRGNRRLLDGELGALIPTATGDACTAETALVVPLRQLGSGLKKGKDRVYVKLYDGSGQRDSDQIKFICLPNPAIASIPCASARQITSTAELIGGPLAMGRVGDWLLENDKARFIVRDVGRDFSFMLTYGGHVMDADLQRKLGPSALAPPYPAGRDSFLAFSPLINISSSDNPTSIVVVNDGSAGGAAVLRTTGPDDLFDPIDPAFAIKDFSSSLSVPPSAVDKNIDVLVSNEYTLECGDHFLGVDTIVTNTGGTDLDLYIGDFTSGGGQLELITPGLGFGEPALRLGTSGGPTAFNYVGWFGFGESTGVSYGLIPEVYANTSSFTDSGVAVPIYGQNLAGLLLAPENNKSPGYLHVPASGGIASFKRWFAVSENGMGQVLDARNTLVARGDIADSVRAGFVQGTVKVDGVPTDGARVTLLVPGSTSGVVSVFETRDGGFFQGSVPRGEYKALVKIPGYPYEGGGSLPLEKSINVGGGTTIIDFDVPTTGFVQVIVTDGVSLSPLAAKVSVVGPDPMPDPGSFLDTPFGTVRGKVFRFDALNKRDIHGLPQVRFVGPSGDTGAFAIPPGDYQFVVSHGPEYSVSKTTLTVTPGTESSPQVINATLVRVVDTTGFISSDHHVHMIASPDSFVSKDERIITMLAEGVEYFTASDHDMLTDLTADVAALGAASLVKTAVSDEITYFVEGHFNAYPLDFPAIPGSVSNGAVDWGDPTSLPGLGYPSDGSYNLSPEETVVVAKGPPYNAKVVQSNHFNSHFKNLGIDSTAVPPQSSTPPGPIRQDPALTNLYTNEITALELWIQTSRSQNAVATGENLGDWFNLLNNFDSTNPNFRKTATFDSDTHTTAVDQSGGPRNMIASGTDDPALIDPGKAADNLNEGRTIGTNGPFMRVTIVGSGGAEAGHAIGKSRLVPATTGSATVNVSIQSPTWAEFDRVEIYVNNVPSCVTGSPNHLGGAKKVCTPTPNFVLNPAASTVPVNGNSRLEANVSQVLSGLTQDSWVVVIVKGSDGFSKPLFPMAATDMLPKACSGSPCRACGTGFPACQPFFGNCTVTNQTLAELTDGNLNECGVLALAIANPLFIDRNGDGLYKGVSLPGTGTP